MITEDLSVRLETFLLARQSKLLPSSLYTTTPDLLAVSFSEGVIVCDIFLLGVASSGSFGVDCSSVGKLSSRDDFCGVEGVAFSKRLRLLLAFCTSGLSESGNGLGTRGFWLIYQCTAILFFHPNQIWIIILDKESPPLSLRPITFFSGNKQVSEALLIIHAFDLDVGWVTSESVSDIHSQSHTYAEHASQFCKAVTCVTFINH